MILPEWYTRLEPVLTPALRVSPIAGGAVILAWRVRETRVPLSKKAIVIPPLAMSTGFGMFFTPLTRVPWTWAVSALLVGAFVLCWPLLRSTRLELRNGVVYMQRSRAFLLILLALLGIRLALHDYIGHLISPLQTAAVFYVLAFGMIVRWRFSLYRQFVALHSASLRSPNDC